MLDPKEVKTICDRLQAIPAKDWQCDGGKIYAEKGGLKFYLSSRTERKADHQHAMLIGEGENSEITDIGLSYDVRYITLDVIDADTRAKERYEGRGGILEYLYDVVAQNMATYFVQQEKAQKARNSLDLKEKIDRL